MGLCREPRWRPCYDFLVIVPLKQEPQATGDCMLARELGVGEQQMGEFFHGNWPRRNYT